jgi:magnesium transporter
MAVEEALTYLREKYEDLEEEIYDVYVVDEQEHLVGRVTLRELLTAEPEALVESIMDDNVIKVTTTTDQEQAAERLGRYDLLSIPVVDERGVLRGIITADDVFDVLHEEATEDIYQSSGINTGAEDSELLGHSVRSAFAARLPWLMVTLMIESGSASVIKHFDFVIQQTVAAASFMPLLSGVTGSVATQSTCIIIRSGTPGQVDWKSAKRNLFHEIKVGMLLGLTCGIFTSVISVVLHNTKSSLGLVVGCSLFLTMTAGVTIGTLMPMLFQKLGVDPAHASGPFITSILDVCTMSIYLSIVYTFLEHLI